MREIRICFVCLGNICRSPAAEGIARVLGAQYKWLTEVDSVGLGPWHVGEPPHPTMRRVAQQAGFPLEDLRARQIRTADFQHFDWIYAMDHSVWQDLHRMQQKTPGTAEVSFFLEAAGLGKQDVPDPYYGGIEDFKQSFDLIYRGTQALLQKLETCYNR